MTSTGTGGSRHPLLSAAGRFAGAVAGATVTAMWVRAQFIDAGDRAARINIEREVPELSDEMWQLVQNQMSIFARDSDPEVRDRAEDRLLYALQVRRTTR
jgi:hypothetical protein